MCRGTRGLKDFAEASLLGSNRPNRRVLSHARGLFFVVFDVSCTFFRLDVCAYKSGFSRHGMSPFFTVTVPPCSQRPRKPIEVTVAAARASLHRRRGLAAAISERYGTPARGWRFTYVAACISLYFEVFFKCGSTAEA